MCDPSKRKSQGYCRRRNKLRTVTTTKWELPLPGSKSYWDKICDDLEQRKEHVSDSETYPVSPSPNVTPDPNVILNSGVSTLSKLKYVAEPIVKISPPTPMRMVPQSRKFTVTDGLMVNENDQNDLTNSDLSNGMNLANVNQKTDARLYEISVCMTEFLKNNNVQTKKSCQLHKNYPPLKIFDDNLKKFLPKKKMMLKSPSTRLQPILPSTLSDLSELHTNNSCPFREQPMLKDRTGIGITLTENKIKVSPRLRRSRTEGLRESKPESKFDRNVRFNSTYQILDKKSKHKVLMSNLNYMLNIPKLNNVSNDQNFFKLNDDTLNEEEQIQAILEEHDSQVNSPLVRRFSTSKLETVNSGSPGFDDKSEKYAVKEKLSDELSAAPNEQMKKNERGVGKCRIGTAKSRHQPEKDFLKVPKLGAISSYPSFSKLTFGDSLETEGSSRQVDQGLTEKPSQKAELCKRDFLKVPKLSMMSSYPSFTSLIPDSLDSDDNTTGASELIPKHIGRETSSNISASSNFKSTEDTSIFNEKRSYELSGNYNDSSDLVATRNTPVSPSLSSSQTEKPKRRQSLKDSVRYAYRALKFITPNKNLNFQPKTYHPPQESGSSTGSDESSHDSRFSKFEPAIKLLTYEDIDKDGPHIRSASSSTYGTIRSRLRQNASQYLGSDYVYPSSRGRLATASTTIPSLTRSTSGPTLNFQEPVFERPSERVLNKLPKMSIFPRRKYDKCFACLHKAFEKPVKCRRELPLATLSAVVKDTTPTISESESSSISLPDMNEFVESQSDYEDDWTDILKSTKKSFLLDKTEWKSSRGLLRTNVDVHRSRQSLVRASEESQSLKSDAKVDNLRKNLTTKDSIASNTHPKPLSLSSEHSKPSSLSGHSSESEEPQVQIKPAVPTSECFVSPYAPLHWAPSLDPLKSLKFRKPVSMHGRAVSITKTEDDSTSDDNANDFRSTRKETKLINASARKVTDQNQDSANVESSAMKSGEESSLVKQPSVVAQIITSQSSTIANLGKKQSRVDLFSKDSKGENKVRNAPDAGDESPKGILTDSQIVKTGSRDNEQQIVNDPNKQARSIGGSVTRSPLPQITEQFTENGSPMDKDDNENLLTDRSTGKPSLNENDRSVSEMDVSTKFQDHELKPEESQDLGKEACNIYSSERVTEVLKACVEEERTPFEMLEALNAVAMQNDPFTSKETTSDPEIARSAKIAKNLMKLLIGSKKYLNPDTFSPHLQFSSQQIPLCNPRQLRRVLPPKTYNLVARILGMPENPVDKSLHQKLDLKSGQLEKDPFKLRHNRGLGADSCDMIVHPPSSRGGRRPIIDEDDFEYPQQSPYALFMNKPRRKAIKWRPLTERDMLGYDPEATLNMRATRVTNKICEDFCKWLRGLGGGHSEDIDEEVLRDMFQIEFTAEACRAMQVLIQEIPMVPIAVALARNTPGAGELALTRRHLIRDAKAESMPKKIIGFGSMLPQDRRFVPPKNRVDERWLQCRSVPRDLETMETVWKGITHLDSVKGFLAWVKAHPGVKPPRILTEAYARKETLLRQPSTEEASGHIELEMDQIESLKVGDAE